MYLVPFLYCRPPEFTLMPQGKYLAGGQQSGCTVNSTGVQYKFHFTLSRLLPVPGISL